MATATKPAVHYNGSYVRRFDGNRTSTELRLNDLTVEVNMYGGNSDAIAALKTMFKGLGMDFDQHYIDQEAREMPARHSVAWAPLGATIGTAIPESIRPADILATHEIEFSLESVSREAMRLLYGYDPYKRHEEEEEEAKEDVILSRETIADSVHVRYGDDLDDLAVGSVITRVDMMEDKGGFAMVKRDTGWGYATTGIGVLPLPLRKYAVIFHA
jgi:hypothetical protein